MNYFLKALRSFETCVLANNNLCRKLFPSLESPTTFDESYKVPCEKSKMVSFASALMKQIVVFPWSI